MKHLRTISLAALASALLATTAVAQDLMDRPEGPPAAGDMPIPASDEEVTFSAERLDYDDINEVVTASGEVRMLRAGNRLRADRISWNQRTGNVRAEGNVAITNPGGDTAYGDTVELTDSLKDGVIDNLLLVLADGGRLAARRGTRAGDIASLDRAAYTPCNVTDSAGCPQAPAWQITAVRVIHRADKRRIYYRNARVSLFGLPILWLPNFSHPDGSQGGGSGLLLPDFRYSQANGAEFSVPYYIRLGDNHDLTITPHIYSEVLPAIDAQYRALTRRGAFQIRGFATQGRRLAATIGTTAPADRNESMRGYFDASGRFQLSPAWALSGSIRLTTDKTFLRRYDISRDDRLRSTIAAERVSDNSYFSIAGWAVQSLRATDDNRTQPIAIPAIDYRLRLADPLLGGQIALQLNSLNIIRREGQDTARAFASARWDLRRITTLGQEVTFTAYGRVDAYRANDVLSTVTPSYRGREGWTTRGIIAGAADMRWPFVGNFLGGTHLFTPRVQVVASPKIRNLAIPNEDARAVDLEDSNLFALNRFPGYDRWEDSSRVTYGAEWSFTIPRVAFRSVVGQSYRLSERPTILPIGTGLSGRRSDIVGRTVLQYGRLIELTHRYRLDKDSLAFRRNEVDVTLGTQRTYASIAYFRLNRNVDQTLEDLRDREEVRLGGRLQFAKYWSIFGSTVIDLTDAAEDPVSLSDGYEPVRHRLGILYNDDCLELGVTWRRDYDALGDARRGNTFLLQIALKNLGR